MAHATAKGRTRRPRMTADQARQFGRFSVHNATVVASSLECDCDPYADVFTFKRWIAQGRVVRRGQHGIKIGVVVEREANEHDGGDRLFARSTVFCRCQTDALEPRK